MLQKYDIIIVGAGHAGNEAAAAAANLGKKTLLITMNMDAIGQMSCNPAMGGIAKGQIIREIDAIGGYSGIVSDKSMIQFRMLNRSKGPAMWSPRSQNDRMKFAQEWRLSLEQTQNLDFWQDMVVGLTTSKNKITGVKTQLGIEIKAKAVVLTNGTFLNGLIHIGEKNFGGGRAGERNSVGLTEQLESLGFESGRMKTGTPPRVDSRSLDFSKMEEQPGEENPGKFSHLDTPTLKNQRSCHITYTNNTVHDLLREGFDRSPMFSGKIQGLGPRYCPSIEDKIERFSERERHQIFVEPEGWNTVETYINGFSTSLPEEIQLKALKMVPGFENVKMFRPGYAIEYDFFQPTQLKNTLETKNIEHLYFAGQINGTTGYEEAGAQGLIAGINAALKIDNKEPFILKRSDAYIGVLIDDLITKGTKEPYRMFTSRAEYRILLRQDNADVRLTPLSHSIGLASDERLKKVEFKNEAIKEIEKFASKESVTPEEVNAILLEKNSTPFKQKDKSLTFIKRPQVGIFDLYNNLNRFENKLNEISNNNKSIIEQAEIQIKYDGYIKKEQELANKLERLEDIKLSKDFNYKNLKSLSSEAVEKLEEIKPNTLGQASRISGVSPSDVSVIMIAIGR